MHSISNTLSSTTSATSVDGALSSVASPIEITNIPQENEFLILNTSRFNITYKLLDKVLYLRKDTSGSKLTLLRGYLCVYVRKPVRIKHIQLKFEGALDVRYFPSNMKIDPSSTFVKNKSFPIFSQSRNWQYKQHDKVLDTDYFAKGAFSYPFQFLIPNDIPETMSNVFGSTSYCLTVTVSPISNTLGLSILGSSLIAKSFPIQVVQCDTEQEGTCHVSNDSFSLGNWRYLFYYKIVISNRQVAIGDKVKVYVKILPKKAFKYRIRNIKVLLDQITEYDISNRLEENERDKFYHKLSSTETALLEWINVDSYDNDPQVWEFDCELSRVFEKYNLKNRYKKQSFTLVPTTNELENRICHFKVFHKIKVYLSVEEIVSEDDTISEFSDNASSFIIRPRAHSLDKTLMNTRAEKIDNDQMRRNSPLVQESDPNKSKVDLVFDADVEILKGESVVGNMPPPTYTDSQIIPHLATIDNSNTSKTDILTIIDSSKTSQNQQLNFILPPAYEEVEELTEPPLYLYK